MLFWEKKVKIINRKLVVKDSRKQFGFELTLFAIEGKKVVLRLNGIEGIHEVILSEGDSKLLEDQRIEFKVTKISEKRIVFLSISALNIEDDSVAAQLKSALSTISSLRAEIEVLERENQELSGRQQSQQIILENNPKLAKKLEKAGIKLRGADKKKQTKKMLAKKKKKPKKQK